MTQDTTVIGRIRTMAPTGDGRASSLRIHAGLITQVETRRVEPAGRVLDFGERTVLPAFVDPHAHLEVVARARATMVDCRVPRCRSIADVLDALSDGLRAGLHGSGWLRAQANLFFDQKLSDRRYPTRQELDSVSTTVPIAIHAGGHTSLLNTEAMRQAKIERFIGRRSGAMGGAVVECDDSGSPTGLVSEIDDLLGIPESEHLDLPRALTDAARELFTRFGVTVVGEISDTIEGLRAMVDLAAVGLLPQRINAFVCAPGTVPFDHALHPEDLIDASERVAIQGIKVFADGGYSAKNAAVHTPYRPEYAVRRGSRGKINLSRRVLASMLRRAGMAGLRLAVHANGERAQETACAAAAAVRSLYPDLPAMRVEHAGNLLTRPEALEQWRATGIVPVPQPVFLYNFGDFFPVYLGPVASLGRFPFRLLSERGFDVPGSSDVYLGAEDGQTNPFFSMWCCLKRQTFLGQIIEPEQRISLDAALRMHTIFAARALGLDKHYGSLEVGKAADLVVLDRDPDTGNPDDLLKINVDHVLVNGKLIYSRPGAAPPREVDETSRR